jgi:hypothetical protein
VLTPVAGVAIMLFVAVSVDDGPVIGEVASDCGACVGCSGSSAESSSSSQKVKSTAETVAMASSNTKSTKVDLLRAISRLVFGRRRNEQ